MPRINHVLKLAFVALAITITISSSTCALQNSLLYNVAPNNKLGVVLPPTSPSRRSTDMAKSVTKTNNIASNIDLIANTTASPASIEFSPRYLRIRLQNSTLVLFNVRFDPDAVKAILSDRLSIVFTAITWSPQFNILTLTSPSATNSSTGTDRVVITLTKQELALLNYSYPSSLNVTSFYIGRATIVAEILVDTSINKTSLPKKIGSLDIVSYREDGILETLFKLSAIGVVVINFFNIGTQLSLENLSKLLSSPRTTTAAFFITVIAMPLISWTAGYLLVYDQIDYWFGAFLVGTCPAASSGPFYVLMLKADQELGVTLQLLSTVAATITMPIWMMTLGNTITQGRYNIKIPYLTLIGTMFLLLQALAIGFTIGKCSPKVSKFIAKVIRPFTLAIVTFLVLFSTIAYWFIFKMFDWRLTLLGTVISLGTYVIAALVAFVVKREIVYAKTVSVISSYKNTGIAFAVLLVAMENPDCYIAFVPCLTQILSAATIIYAHFTIVHIYNRIRGGGDAECSDDSTEIDNDGKSARGHSKLAFTTADASVALPDEIDALKTDEK